MFLIALVAGILTGCAWLKSTAHDAKQAIEDCTTAERSKAIDEFTPVVEPVIVGAIDAARGADGSIDWAKFKADAKSTALGALKETGACVAANIFASWIAGKKSLTGPEIDPDEASAAFAALRSELWPGVSFKTEAGTL